MSDGATGLAEPKVETRGQRLKRATAAIHQALDARMMSANLFSDRTRYALFLSIQRRFHQEIEALYRDDGLVALVPDLASRRKLDEIDRDIADVGAKPPADGAAIDPADKAAALGWLYVAEGSSLGAAFLFKEAEKLGLSGTFGARHLAAHPSGRMPRWRRFVEALDAAALTDEEETRAETAAVAAFNRVGEIARQVLATGGG